MSASPGEVPDLDYWLRHIAAVHPREIELGLDRIRTVAEAMQLAKPAAHVIVVAGTNGKGSCVACLEAVLQQAGVRTASYTSPHLYRFNERIRIAATEVSDSWLCEAFSIVEQCRGAISLSYFEFATLAALWIFKQSKIDVALLEVGLGGRLDAVNIIDADVAVITNISLDHQDWLGNDVESIAAEKAGICRPDTPLVYGESEPPRSIVRQAQQLAAPIYSAGSEFRWQQDESTRSWSWRGADIHCEAVTLTDLPIPAIALANAATALQALALLPVSVSAEACSQALKQLSLAGRFEARVDRKTGTTVILDVAHNPAAAKLLATSLSRFKRQNPSIVRISAVMAVMADKDIEGIASALESCLDICYIAQVEEPRCMPAREAFSRLGRASEKLPAVQFASLTDAYEAACNRAADQELVVVTGSFYTVAAVRDLSGPA